MWRLKIAAGGNPWLRTTNNHIGRQVWEFDPKQTPSPREIEEIENARQNFTENRFRIKHSADLIMRMQFEKENPVPEVLPQVKVKESEEVTEEAVTATVKRALNFYSSMQARSFNRRQQILGVFEWSGNNPMPPETWLLPYLLPVHPGTMML